jgi:hypothetical protein
MRLDDCGGNCQGRLQKLGRKSWRSIIARRLPFEPAELAGIKNRSLLRLKFGLTGRKHNGHSLTFSGRFVGLPQRCEAVIALRNKEGRDAPAVRGRLVKLKADFERTSDRPIRPHDRELSPKMAA